MQKILIFSVTAGTGHNAVANALKQKLTEMGKTVKIVDTFKEYDKKFKQLLVNDGYLVASTLLPHIFNKFFEHYEKADPNKRDMGSTQNFLKELAPKMLKTIYSFKPDVILCTHFYPGIIITNLRKAFPINAKVISLLTDYVVHPFWESSIGIDYIITPSESLTDTLIYKGFKPEQIKCLGYPIQEKFSNPITKEEARQKLNLNNDVLTVCVTCGGMGYAKMPELIKKLLKVKYPLQIISVCGKHKPSKQKIDKLIKTAKVKNSNKKVLNYGYSNEIDVLFAAADVMVSKGGCTFINEAMSKTLPQIFIKTLPLQEQYNAEYLKSNDAGFIATKSFDIDKIINKVCKNPDILETYKQNIIKIRKTNALNDVCNFISRLNPGATYKEDIAEIKAYYVNKQIRLANRKNKKNAININDSYKTYKRIYNLKKSTKSSKNKLFKMMDKKVG